MPDLDVSFMTADPMFADCFNVTRRQDVVTTKGRAVPTTEAVFRDIVGVVTQVEPDALQRQAEGQNSPRRILVCTTFRCQGVVDVRGSNYQPDIITWNGTDYLVTQVLPYSRFGDGTYEVSASSQTVIDKAQ